MKVNEEISPQYLNNIYKAIDRKRSNGVKIYHTQQFF